MEVATITASSSRDQDDKDNNDRKKKPDPDFVEVASATFAEEARCPVCHQIPIGQIVMCEIGHIICASCRPKLFHCALCRNDLTTTRNLALERVIGDSTIRCPFSDSGCNEIQTGDNMVTHIGNCQHRPPIPIREAFKIGSDHASTRLQRTAVRDLRDRVREYEEFVARIDRLNGGVTQERIPVRHPEVPSRSRAMENVSGVLSSRAMDENVPGILRHRELDEMERLQQAVHQQQEQLASYARQMGIDTSSDEDELDEDERLAIEQERLYPHLPGDLLYLSQSERLNRQVPSQPVSSSATTFSTTSGSPLLVPRSAQPTYRPYPRSMATGIAGMRESNNPGLWLPPPPLRNARIRQQQPAFTYPNTFIEQPVFYPYNPLSRLANVTYTPSSHQLLAPNPSMTHHEQQHQHSQPLDMRMSQPENNYSPSIPLQQQRQQSLSPIPTVMHRCYRPNCPNYPMMHGCNRFPWVNPNDLPDHLRGNPTYIPTTNQAFDVWQAQMNARRHNFEHHQQLLQASQAAAQSLRTAESNNNNVEQNLEEEPPIEVVIDQAHSSIPTNNNNDDNQV